MSSSDATYWVSLAAVVAGTLLAGAAAAGANELHAEFEAGAVVSSRNDTRIPGDSGTTLSLVDDLSTSATPAFRLRVGARLAGRHVVSLLYAPLRLTARGQAEGDVTFRDAVYPAGGPLLAVYRFDSYRATYRYSFLHRPGLEVAAGVTAKIRSAETSLYGAEARRKTNVGFVPLANLHVEWRPAGDRFGLILDADALAAPQGRAADVLVAASWTLRNRVALFGGYRMLEGGADNDEVYSFAWLHYFVAGARLRFGAF